MDQNPNKENRVNYDDIEIGNVNAGGGTMHYYKDEPYTGIIVEYNDQGVLVAEFSVKDGHDHRKSILYHDNGQIREEHFRSYNRPYGLYREWDEQGNLMTTIDFGPEYDPTLDQ